MVLSTVIPWGPGPALLYSGKGAGTIMIARKSSRQAGIGFFPICPEITTPGALTPPEDSEPLDRPGQPQKAYLGSRLNTIFALTKNASTWDWSHSDYKAFSPVCCSDSKVLPSDVPGACHLVSHLVRLCLELWPLSPLLPRCAHLAWSLSSDRWD